MALMEVRFIDIYLIITLFAVSLVLFSIAAFPKEKKEGTRYLGFALGVFITHLTIIWLNNAGYLTANATSNLTFLLNLSYGPLFLAYFKRVIKSEGYNWRYFGLWMVAGLVIPITQYPYVIYEKLIIISLIGHLFLIIDLLFRSKANEIQKWHRLTFIFFVALCFTYLFETTLITEHTEDTVWHMRFFYFTELLCLVFGFFYFSLRYPESFSVPKNSDLYRLLTSEPDPTAPTEISLLIRATKENRLYKQPNMNRATLTDQTGISINRISELINKHFGINFSEWVNSYRIEEAKSLLRDQQFEGSIKEIYFDVGFNSKSAFNKAFKKHTGLTPSAYRASKNHTSR
ncbi:MAG: AraC family transcriptional regulator [Roseivirga sp.]|nr:AraC family transcriptional regulator [Roseivirga sp.]